MRRVREVRRCVGCAGARCVGGEQVRTVWSRLCFLTLHGARTVEELVCYQLALELRNACMALTANPAFKDDRRFRDDFGQPLGRRLPISPRASGGGRIGSSPGISSIRSRRSPKASIIWTRRSRRLHLDHEEATVCARKASNGAVSGSGDICWTARMRPTCSGELGRRTSRTVRTPRTFRTCAPAAPAAPSHLAHPAHPSHPPHLSHPSHPSSCP